MSGVPSPELKNYFEEARSWDADRVRAAERSRRLAWMAAAFAAVAATVASAAVAALAPLKTVEPFVVRVDRSTGAVDVVTALTSARPITYDEAVTKHFLAQYVRAREGWLAPAAEANFRQVAIMSSTLEQQRWAEAFRSSNPMSPQVLYGQGAEALVEIRTISFISPGVASIRFRRTLRAAGQVSETDWIATAAYAYSKAPMSEADRLRNPLGFQVASYRADAEAVR